MGPRLGGYPVVFLGLNLLMSAVPVGAALWLEARTAGRSWSGLRGGERAGALALGVLWLVTMPHTAYAATLVRHLCDSGESSSLAAILLFVAVALVGLGAFHSALSHMRVAVARLGSEGMARILPVVVVPAVALGVRLGVERVDSWDLVVRPTQALAAAARVLGAPEGRLDLGTTAALLLLMYVGIDRYRARNTARPG